MPYLNEQNVRNSPLDFILANYLNEFILCSCGPRGIAIAIARGLVVCRGKVSLFERSVRKCVGKIFHHFVLSRKTIGFFLGILVYFPQLV